jgi:hypothetical protein
MRSLLLPLEAAFRLATRSRPLTGSRGTFLLSVHPHRGSAMRLRDGTVVRRGDPVAEIHFWNQRIAAYAAHGARELTWALLRDLRADLATLAAALGELPAGRRPLAVYGVTPLAEGAVRLGFETRPLPRGASRLALSWWQGRILGRAFRPVAGGSRRAPASQEVWLSYGALVDRFGGQGSAS